VSDTRHKRRVRVADFSTAQELSGAAGAILPFQSVNAIKEAITQVMDKYWR